MNWKNILNYTCFIILLWTIPFLVNFIVEKLDGDKGDPMFFTIFFLLFGINILFAGIKAKCKWWKKNCICFNYSCLKHFFICSFS